MQQNVFAPLLYLSLLLIAVLCFAVFRFVNSDPRVAMRNMRRELDAAKKLLEEYRVKESQWAKDMALATTRWRNAEGQLEELLAQVDRLQVRLEEKIKTIDVQNEVIERGERYQKAQQEKIEWLVGRVVQMDASNGIVSNLPWNT